MAVLDGEARVLLTAQHILKSLGTTDAMADDMLQVLSKFDHRFSNMTDKNLEKRSDPSTSQNSQGERPDEDYSYQGFDVSKEGCWHDRKFTNLALDSAGKVIVHWDMGYSEQGYRWIFESTAEESQAYLDAVDEVLTELDTLKIHNRDPQLLEEAQHLLQLAMERLEEELRHVLERYTGFVDPDVLLDSFSAGSLSIPEEITEDDEGVSNSRSLRRSQSKAVALIPAQAAQDIISIVTRLIAGGFKKECVQVYISSRKIVLEESLRALGVEKLSIDEVQRMPWEVQEGKIKSWVQAMNVGVRVLFASEQQLCNEVFSPPLSEICYNDVAKGAMMQLLSFGEAIAISRRSPEKLFKILDMYETLRNLLPDLNVIFSGASGASVRSEAKGIVMHLGEAARGTFTEFENAIQRDSSKIPVLGGAVHPLNRYVMNYSKLLCDYTDILKQLFEEKKREVIKLSGDDSELPEYREDDVGDKESPSALAVQINCLMHVLRINLETKSKVYRDPALSNLFLMNNIHYIVQKVKSTEVRALIGDDSVRKHIRLVRQYATNYQRAAWGKVLSFLKDEGIRNGGMSNGVSRVTLKDRFKNFNAAFDEAHRIQSQWVVHDPQLRDELRISIADKLLPAYRAFVGRYGHFIETGKHPDKYIKYTVEDLELYIGGFFEGTTGSMSAARRSFSFH